MKKLFLLIIGFAFSLTMIAQGNKNNNGGKKEKSPNAATEQKQKQLSDKKEKDEHNKKVWAGTNSSSISSKNQPAKVRAAFQRDYPNGGNVTWSKYRGDWTATFKNGLLMSTA